MVKKELNELNKWRKKMKDDKLPEPPAGANQVKKYCEKPFTHTESDLVKSWIDKVKVNPAKPMRIVP